MYLKNDITKDDLIYKYDGDTLLKKDVKQDDKIGTYYILYNNEILCSIDFDFNYYNFGNKYY